MEEVKVPLALAAQNLATLMEAIDNGNLEEAVLKLFDDQRLALSASVDRRICFFDICEKHIESLNDIANKYKVTAKQLETVLETVKKRTVEIMNSIPDTPYKGDLGRLTIQKNASPSCMILLNTQKKSINHAVDAQDIEKHKIRDEFYDVHTYYSLVIDKIRKAIEAGEDIPWAVLQKGEHLRISRK